MSHEKSKEQAKVKKDPTKSQKRNVLPRRLKKKKRNACKTKSPAVSGALNDKPFYR